MSVLHFIWPQGDSTVCVKLVTQQVALNGVVSNTIFGLDFSCHCEGEVGGKRETAQPNTDFLCVCVHASFSLCVSL